MRTTAEIREGFLSFFEEKGHLRWVKRWLDEQAAARGPVVGETLARYTAADALVYAKLTAELEWRVAA